jgi:hypothetical protein
MKGDFTFPKWVEWLVSPTSRFITDGLLFAFSLWLLSNAYPLLRTLGWVTLAASLLSAVLGVVDLVLRRRPVRRLADSAAQGHLVTRRSARNEPNHSGSETEPLTATRPLTPTERTLVEFLLRNDHDPGAETLLAQLETARYAGPWFEGSQSFDIEVPAGAPLDPTLDSWKGGPGPFMSDGRRIGPGAIVYMPERPHTDEYSIGEIFLWIENGRMSALEYPWWTDEMPDRLPGVNQLT